MASLSAALVIAAGVLVAERFEPRRSAAPLAATPLPSLALPVEESGRAPATTGIVAAPTIARAASASAAIVAAPTVASAAPVAPAAPIVAAPTIPAEPGDPAGLAPDRGYLVLTGAAGARTYVNGADVGPSEERIVVPCGARYVRIGTPAEKGRPTSWVTAGRSVVVACRGETKVDLAR